MNDSMQIRELIRDAERERDLALDKAWGTDAYEYLDDVFARHIDRLWVLYRAERETELRFSYLRRLQVA